MIDQRLSNAVITYVGYDGSSSIPGRHPERIIDPVTRQRVEEIMSWVTREEPGGQGLWVWGDEVADKIRIAHPDLSAEAVDAIESLITFEWR